MGIFKRAYQEKRDYSLSDPLIAQVLGLVDSSDISPDKMREATYFTCVRILCDTVAKLPLKLYQDTDQGIQKLSNHYLYSLLKLRPNPYMSAVDFWKMVEMWRNEFGHAIVYIDTNPSTGKINALYPLEMTKITIWVDNAGIIGNQNAIYYVYTTNIGQQFKLSENEILHFKGLTRDGITGMSIKDYLLTIIENAQSSERYLNNYFKNGLFSKGLLQFTGDLSDDKIKLMQERFQNMASGIQNAGKILPVPLGFSFQPINTNMADAQFFELNKLTIQQITAAFGIPLHMLNDLSNGTFNNVSMMEEQFYRDTLMPILTMYEQELTYKLLTQQEIQAGLYFKFNVDAILRSDIETRYKAYSMAIQNGFLTPNEARIKEELPTRPEGDVLICNGNYQPLQNVGMAYLPKDTNAQQQKGGN
jgi:HK97 family phage portal protein